MEYDDIKEIEKELPMRLEKAFELFKLPFIIYKDRWIEEGLGKFIVLKVSKDNEKLRVFGNFIYFGKVNHALKELRYTDHTYRVEKYDSEMYK